MSDDSAERNQHLTSTTYHQLYCLFSYCFRIQFPEIFFSISLCSTYIFGIIAQLPDGMTCLLLKVKIIKKVKVLLGTWPSNM